MRLRMFSGILFCVLLSSVSLALPSPNVWWDRNDPGATYAEWGFDNGDNPAAPENYDGPDGADPPQATITITGIRADGCCKSIWVLTDRQSLGPRTGC